MGEEKNASSVAKKAGVAVVLAAGAIAWMTLLGGNAEVYVQCAGAVIGIQCEVEHRKGNDALRVCWDYVVTCQNGTVATASGCQIVQPQSKATKLIPVQEIRNNAACDAPASTEVRNVRTNEVD